MAHKKARPQQPVTRLGASGNVDAGAFDNPELSTSQRRFQGKTLRSLADLAILDLLSRPIDPVEPEDRGGDHG
jgi:hypothetical protein